MLGLMQDWPLTVDRILDHAKANFPRREVVTRSIETARSRAPTTPNVWRRAKQVTNALQERGIQPGDRVATLAWNTERHMEAWYGAMCMGAVLHTVNPRLFPEQIAWIINHAEDKILFFDTTFMPIVEKIAPLLKTVQAYVVLTDREHMPQVGAADSIAYEDFIAGHAQEAQWGGFDENTACGLCYTSGTTGDPEGRALLAPLQRAPRHGGQPDRRVRLRRQRCRAADRADVPRQCLGDRVRRADVRREARDAGREARWRRASTNCWKARRSRSPPPCRRCGRCCLSFLRENKLKPTTLKRVAIGGSAIPETVLRAFEEDYGVEVIHAWGMTEMSPIGTHRQTAARALRAWTTKARSKPR